ncbi:MAG: GlcG/HbpS family heme-binding protein, partial [Acetobacteraceae bacterium]
MLTYQTLSLAEAQLMLDAAQRTAEQLGVPEVLCVADAAGYPIALRRLDNGKVSSVQIALNKAFTAAAHRKPTHQYKNALPGEEAFGIFTQH